MLYFDTGSLFKLGIILENIWLAFFGESRTQQGSDRTEKKSSKKRKYRQRYRLHKFLGHCHALIDLVFGQSAFCFHVCSCFYQHLVFEFRKYHINGKNEYINITMMKQLEIS